MYHRRMKAKNVIVKIIFLKDIKKISYTNKEWHLEDHFDDIYLT